MRQLATDIASDLQQQWWEMPGYASLRPIEDLIKDTRYGFRMLRYESWKNRYGGDPHIIGRNADAEWGAAYDYRSRARRIL